MTPQETEQLLDRTLHALGNAQPAPGFAERLEARLAQEPTTTSPWLHFSLLRLALTLSVAAMLCAAILLYPHAKYARPADLAVATPKPEQHAEDVSQHSDHLLQSTSSQLEGSDLVAQQSPLRALAPSTPIQLHLTTAQSSISSEDAQALADLHTPSFPAPPLELTEQERMVLLMLRHGEKHDLAELDGTQTNAAFSRRRAEFSSFFDPPPPPPPESVAPQAPDPAAAVSGAPANPAPAPSSSSSPKPQPPGDPQ